MRVAHFEPCFVEFIPEDVKPGILYVSMVHSVVVHLCACGCGRRTVTPLSPTDWRLMFDGRNVSLRPSIGNWAYPCRSHYWISDGGVHWAANMSEEEVAGVRQRGQYDKAAFYSKPLGGTGEETQKIAISHDGSGKGISAVIRRLFDSWRGGR